MRSKRRVMLKHRSIASNGWWIYWLTPVLFLLFFWLIKSRHMLFKLIATMRYFIKPSFQPVPHTVSDAEQQILPASGSVQVTQETATKTAGEDRTVEVAPITEEQSNDAHAVSTAATSVPTRSVLPFATYDYQANPPEDYEQEKERHAHTRLYPSPQSLPGDDGVLPYGWRIIGASVRGYGHVYDRKYREDDFMIYTQHLDAATTATLVSLADGVGSKAYARQGALAAVEGSASIFTYEPIYQELAKMIASLQSWDGDQKIVPPELEHATRLILKAAMQSASERVKERAVQLNCQSRDLHSTLQVFLVIPLSAQRLFIASNQVGDGALFARTAGSYQAHHNTWYRLQRQQIQMVGNEVIPLLYTGPEQWEATFQCGIYDNVIFLMAMTDGTADDLTPALPMPGDIEPDPCSLVESFYAMLKTELHRDAYSSEVEALKTFLSYRKPQSYDDRTVICVYRDALE